VAARLNGGTYCKPTAADMHPIFMVPRRMALNYFLTRLQIPCDPTLAVGKYGYVVKPEPVLGPPVFADADRPDSARPAVSFCDSVRLLVAKGFETTLVLQVMMQHEGDVRVSLAVLEALAGMLPSDRATSRYLLASVCNSGLICPRQQRRMLHN
jgi:hypothetical protein